jgi:hypothetical protein
MTETEKLLQDIQMLKESVQIDWAALASNLHRQEERRTIRKHLLPGWEDVEGSRRIGNVSRAAALPSSASHRSVSCCEDYAILHDLSGQTLRLRFRVPRVRANRLFDHLSKRNFNHKDKFG